jgi:pleiotropic regulator 1
MHIAVGLAVSQRHTYLFSAGDDKQVKCWDLEQNKVSLTFKSSAFFGILASIDLLCIFLVKVIRSYHGHLSGVYCLALHPTIDILLTGGRDSVCRVWNYLLEFHIMKILYVYSL